MIIMKYDKIRLNAFKLLFNEIALLEFCNNINITNLTIQTMRN